MAFVILCGKDLIAAQRFLSIASQRNVFLATHYHGYNNQSALNLNRVQHSSFLLGSRNPSRYLHENVGDGLIIKHTRDNLLNIHGIEKSSLVRARLGSGSPVLVLHGGPGLSHDYLFNHLEWLSKYRDMIFFDQYGCGKDEHLARNIEECVGQIDNIAHIVCKPTQKFGLLAHSWGSYLALEYMKSRPERIKELMLISPMPFVYDIWINALANFDQNLPHEVISKISTLISLNTPEARKEVMNILHPFYIGKSSKLHSLDFKPNFRTNQHIRSLVKPYDHTPLVRNLHVDGWCVIGKDDFFWKNQLKDLKIGNLDLYSLQGLGHYPFAEDSEQFQKVLRKYFDR